MRACAWGVHRWWMMFTETADASCAPTAAQTPLCYQCFQCTRAWYVSQPVITLCSLLSGRAAGPRVRALLWEGVLLSRCRAAVKRASRTANCCSKTSRCAICAPIGPSAHLLWSLLLMWVLGYRPRCQPTPTHSRLQVRRPRYCAVNRNTTCEEQSRIADIASSTTRSTAQRESHTEPGWLCPSERSACCVQVCVCTCVCVHVCAYAHVCVHVRMSEPVVAHAGAVPPNNTTAAPIAPAVAAAKPTTTAAKPATAPAVTAVAAPKPSLSLIDQLRVAVTQGTWFADVRTLLHFRLSSPLSLRRSGTNERLAQLLAKPCPEVLNEV